MSLVTEARAVYENYGSYSTELKIAGGLAVASLIFSMLATTDSIANVFKNPAEKTPDAK